MGEDVTTETLDEVEVEKWYRVPNRAARRRAKSRHGQIKPLRSRIQRKRA